MGWNMSKDVAELEQLLHGYFDGLHDGDVDKLGAIFHEACHLFSVTDGKLNDMSRAQWFDLIKSRPSGRAQGLARHDWVISIDRSGPTTAFAKVHCALPPRFFTDYLTLVKLAGGWRIISKTFHVENR
jgi:hypothetical protein